ncbi:MULTISPECIES: carbonic anhydrase [Streptomyces]|uniref:Carbonic anhydrase n=1 Tax=Streptomyces doudnae TaxID=3075536 RepID=A0ABD5EU65_9ACTN|nr:MULTISPECIES: carbonic anhydrase [unclassified Streptomyces]MDT0437895.1 carbonic anhydrase [Streptomyces sp. DSM 41981]MYQ66939.1 carbonic anhydrase [Streptomyces sp. SID4950]SCE27719.1 carbonic anhydrase [Streptomyces sp. SolWspMP-5a-2]
MASNRRAFLTATAVGALTVAPAQAVPTGTDGGPRPPSPRAALDELLAGNHRYASGRPLHPHENGGRRRTLAAGQHPFAVVVGCVDSRVPPELVFDQGLGDLLCIRTAGQVLDEAVLASVQYGVEVLRVPLVLVLGHERCGAVAATLEHLDDGVPVPGHLELLVEEIAPAARRTRGLPGDWAEHTMTAHTRWVRDAIRADPAFVAAHVAAARFDLDTGLVSLLP